LRIARRDAAQHRGRSALIVFLIAIPMIGLSALAAVETSNQPTPQETVRNALGSTQAKLTVVSTPDPTLQQDPSDPSLWEVGNVGNEDSDKPPTTPHALPSAYLPTGTRILTLRPLAVISQTATGIGSVNAIEGQPWDAAFRGRFAILSGRTPTNDDEIMVTPAALRRLGKTVGQTVSFTQPRIGTFSIVGTMRDLTETTSSERIFARAGSLDGITPVKDLEGTSFYLPDHPLSWAGVQKLNRDGITVLSRLVILKPPLLGGRWAGGGGLASAIQGSLLLLPFIGFSLFEVALLAGAAFMVGIGQQQRSLATLASVGGDGRMLARVVSSAGIVLGLAGGVIGSVCGTGLAWLYLEATSEGSLAAFPGFHVNPFITGGIILLAVLSGWISALVPARRAARIDVVASLRDAARPPRPSRRAPVIGIVVAVVGVVLTAVGSLLLTGRGTTGGESLLMDQLSITLVVVGSITLQVAALVVAPTILRAVARAVGTVGTAARLASRDTARNTSRSVPAVGAIMSTIFVASFLITFSAASQASQTAEYEYRTAAGMVRAQYYQFTPTAAQSRQLTTSLESTLHTSNVTVLESARRPGSDARSTALFALPQLNSAARCTQLPAGPTPVKRGSLSITSPDCQGPEYLTNPEDGAHIWVATAATIARAIGAPLSPTARTALAAGKVVAFYPQYVRNGRVTINWRTVAQMNDIAAAPSARPTKTTSLPAVVQQPPHAVAFDMVMSPATARATGIHYAPSQILAKVPSAPTDAQIDALNAAGRAIGGSGIGGSSVDIIFNYEGGPPVFAGTFQWALLALCAVISLGAASVAIGLARSEGRRDETVLGSLGAPPRLRRAFSFWSAAIITGVGSIGGVLLGTLPALAVSESFVQPGGRAAVPFSPPWAVLAIAAIGLPLLLAVGSWLAAGRARVQYNARAPIE
jgi:hypothetical protein